MEHINYCRNDVRATTELFEKTAAEYARHPISTPATQIYSSATIAKGYLTDMGLIPNAGPNSRQTSSGRQ